MFGFLIGFRLRFIAVASAALLGACTVEPPLDGRLAEALKSQTDEQILRDYIRGIEFHGGFTRREPRTVRIALVDGAGNDLNPDGYFGQAAAAFVSLIKEAGGDIEIVPSSGAFNVLMQAFEPQISDEAKNKGWQAASRTVERRLNAFGVKEARFGSQSDVTGDSPGCHRAYAIHQIWNSRTNTALGQQNLPLSQNYPLSAVRFHSDFEGIDGFLKSWKEGTMPLRRSAWTGSMMIGGELTELPVFPDIDTDEYIRRAFVKCFTSAIIGYVGNDFLVEPPGVYALRVLAVLEAGASETKNAEIQIAAMRARLAGLRRKLR